jgi:hypothetical protein
MDAPDSLRRLARRLSGQGMSAEDERLVALFRNRTELKKELSALDDERHRLLDRLKLQEGATMRVEEQLAALEQYLGRPDEGYKCLAYFQLRAVWRTASRRLEHFSGELARQQKDRQRKQQLAAFERARRERLDDVERELSEARVLADQLQAEQKLTEQRLANLHGFWNHFRRRRLRESIEARRFRIDAALTQVTDLGDRQHAIAAEAPPAFEGLSVEGRRAVNLAVIAYAEAMHERRRPRGMPGDHAARRSCARRPRPARGRPRGHQEPRRPVAGDRGLPLRRRHRAAAGHAAVLGAGDARGVLGRLQGAAALSRRDRGGGVRRAAAGEHP